MLKKIGGFVGTSAVLVMDFLVKVLIVSGSAATGHNAVNSYQSHEAKDNAYSNMEQGAETWIGGYQHNIIYATLWMKGR